MHLIAGLGNPGDKFTNTRHNIGFEVADELQRKLNLPAFTSDKKFKAEVTKSANFILIKPSTFMNLSGMAISSVAQYFKIKPEEIIIIHDELDLPLGHIKIRLGGSDAGHHGIESIIESLGDEKFIRVRLGIGTWHSTSGEHKHAAFNAEKFVVEQFIPGERSKVKSLVKKAFKAVEAILDVGLEKAQNQYNDKGS